MKHLTKILILFLICLYTVLSEDTELYEFSVVSTSQRPNEVTDRLKFEFKLDKVVIDKLQMILEDRLEVSHRELKNSGALLEKQVEEMKKEISELKNSDVLRKKQQEEAKKEVTDLKNSKMTLQEQLKEAKKEIGKLIKSKELLEKQIEDTMKETSKLKLSLDTQIQALHNRIRDNQHECEKNKNRIQELGKNSKMLQNLEKQVIEHNLPEDCKEIQKNEFNFSGVYRIKAKSSRKGFRVWCNMETKDGGWIYFLNRFDGSIDFNLNWTDYKYGFGDLHGELWLGLENLYQITGNQTKELLIELVDWDMKKVYAHYRTFNIGSEKNGYYLKTMDGYSGDAGACLGGHLGNKFSTVDRDQDTWTKNCAKEWGGGWWFNNCYWSLFTGKYNTKPNSATITGESGIKCDTFHGYSYSLKEVRMMIR